MGISDRVEEELSRLWDSGQEWILIFDNLLKHPGGKVSKGCKCDMCEMQKFQHNSAAACSSITANTVQSSSHQQPLPGNLEKSRSGATSPQTSEISGNLTLPDTAVKIRSVYLFGYFILVQARFSRIQRYYQNFNPTYRKTLHRLIFY